MSPEPTVTEFRRRPLRVVSEVSTSEARERGHMEGYSAGWTAGAKAAAAAAAIEKQQREEEFARAEAVREQRLQSALSVLTHAAHALTARTAPVLAAAEAATLEGVVAVAEAALGVELADQATSARAALTKALDGSTPVGVHTVRLSPADLAHVQFVLADKVEVPEGVQLVADPALSNGDAVVEFPDGFVDAKVRTALARARATLLGEEA